jgi:pre-rRNA-processing protein TSR2
VLLRNKIAEEDYAEIDAMHQKFLEKQSKGGAAKKPVVQEVDQEAGSSDEEESADTEMGEAPPPQPRAEPVVDEDGFELVQKKGGKRR